MRPDVLIIARSGRQLAAAARRAGYTPIVIDFFGDADTRAQCAANFVIPPSRDLVFPAAGLADLVRGISTTHGPFPIVCGSGFEDQIHLLAALESRGRLIGCTAATVAACNDPVRLQRGLAELDIECPQTNWTLPTLPGAWLLKRRGGCGGDHVRVAKPESIPGQRDYFAARIDGVPVSVAFVAGAEGVSVLGMCAALQDLNGDAAGFRYAGAVAVPDTFARYADEVHHIAGAVTEYFSLRGLCGIDFIASDSGKLTVLEINPRPCATFDLLAEPGDVFDAHMNGRSGAIRAYADVRASGVCVADRSFTVTDGLDLPPWCADRPRVGTRIAAGMPVCSAYVARAGDVPATRRVLRERVAMLRRTFDCAASRVDVSATAAS
jgi:predicted ATP-grasp superfamily ATP-dependent carboligase